MLGLQSLRIHLAWA